MIFNDFISHNSAIPTIIPSSVEEVEAQRLSWGRIEEEGRVRKDDRYDQVEGGGEASSALGSDFCLLLGHRCHIISQFNQGFYDCVIATDAEVLGPPVKGKHRGKGPKRDK